jgi:paraquat-inducible protein A
MRDTTLIACHECDLLHHLAPVQEGQMARCQRCGAVLYRHKRNSLERTLALAIAGLMLFGMANAFPFLAFKLEARVQQTTLISGIEQLYQQGMHGVAILVFLTTVAFPLLQLLGLLYVYLPLHMGRIPPRLPLVFRFISSLQPWSMMEVFMLGILVSIVKLAKMAKVVPGLSLYSFLVLIFVLTAATSSMDPHLVWQRWEKRQ